MSNFPDTPPMGNMTRKDLMRRLEKKLTADALYVRPVYLDENCSEYGYFIVSIDDPYDTKARQGHDHG